MSGIIGRFYTSQGLSTIGADAYLFHAHVIKVTLILFHLVYVDYDEYQYIINKKR